MPNTLIQNRDILTAKPGYTNSDVNLHSDTLACLIVTYNRLGYTPEIQVYEKIKGVVEVLP